MLNSKACAYSQGAMFGQDGVPVLVVVSEGLPTTSECGRTIGI